MLQSVTLKNWLKPLNHNTAAVSSLCVCPGETVIIECTIIDDHHGATIWEGTAFNCVSKRIILFHDSSPSGLIGECNGGAIIGQRVSIENNTYTSILNVTISREMDDKTITCSHNDMMKGSTEIKLSETIVVPGMSA